MDSIVTAMFLINNHPDMIDDGSGNIVHLSDISFDMIDSTYDVLYVGVYQGDSQYNIMAYITEIDDDGCDCTPEFIQWNYLPYNVQEQLLNALKA